MKRLSLFIVAWLSSGIAWSTEPALDEYHPILPSVFAWEMHYFQGERTLRIYETPTTRLVAEYDLSDCLFCEGEEDNCDMDGVFGINFHGVNRPLVGVACHKGAHSQAFSLFDPTHDKSEPVFRVVGNYAVSLWLDEKGIEVSYDIDVDRQDERAVWPAGYKRRTVTPREPVTFQHQPLPDTAESFHQQLKRLVRQRDAQGFLAYVADDVAMGMSGAVRFRGKQHLLDGFSGRDDGRLTEDSALWELLDELLLVGPALNGSDQLMYPAMALNWDERSNGAYRVSLADDTRIYAAPYRSSPVIQRIGREAVWLADDALNGFQELEGWSAVRTADGVYGFISHEDSIQPLEDIFTFERRQGRWMLTRVDVTEH